MIKINKETKDHIMSGFIAGMTLALIVIVGIIVLDEVGYEVGFLDGYCQDKEGIYNISHLNMSSDFDDLVNCSIKQYVSVSLENT